MDRVVTGSFRDRIKGGSDSDSDSDPVSLFDSGGVDFTDSSSESSSSNYGRRY